ncbi:S1C family serine protease [Staphylococcus lutrae]|uniref:Serine protease HtrA-like n=1 Tax=Staphylococcus lutrae TaxID=155085 RepID=A0AAC9RWY2_9STAP|nr:S1C family serine protease [Staphylococcus lutrae]ARJ51457.1 serine protease [Staphylococcus lutrae]PNZ37981.1 serine protease [Staphylococcus lutrae]
MDRDQKHVIPRHQYKRQRREYFHNEEREARLKAEAKENALKAEKEKAQVKNNEERVKDNLRKARIEKITHDDHEKQSKAAQTESEGFSQRVRPLEETSSVSINGSRAEQTQGASHHKHTVDEGETKKESRTAENTSSSDSQQEDPAQHAYTTKRDWTEKVTAFLTREWAKILIVIAAILILVLLFSIFKNVNQSENHNTKQALQTEQKENGSGKIVTQTMENANNAIKSVVSIENNRQNTPSTDKGTGSQTQIEKESGSGVVYKKVDDTLYILTNAHVVGDRKTHMLTFGDQQTETAEVIGRYPLADIAVMKMKVPKGDVLKPFKLGNSNAIVLGEPVLVIGNPVSLDFQNTVGEGIVSGLKRDVPVDLNQDNTYDTLLNTFQVDAPINPGDSGGAVIDQKGQLIGIASLKINMPSVQNMGFAIPINWALKVAEKIEKEGDIQQPQTYIKLDNIEDISPALRKSLKIAESQKEGVIVREIESNSPAQGSGLKKGDVIVELDHQPIKNTLAYKEKLTEHLDEKAPIELQVIREGEMKNISFKLK